MEQSPSWEANRLSASQGIPIILWNPNAHYSIHKYPTPVPILSQLDLVHNLTFHFLKIYINIILPSTLGSPKWSPPLRFPYQNTVYDSPLPHTVYLPRPSHTSEHYIKRNICNIYKHISNRFSRVPHEVVCLTYLLTYLLNYLLHGAESFLRIYTYKYIFVHLMVEMKKNN